LTPARFLVPSVAARKYLIHNTLLVSRGTLLRDPAGGGVATATTGLPVGGKQR
jgi:hypothetical protein